MPSLSFPERAEIVVVGGGFAGAATSCFLGRLGAKDVVLIEAEEVFGAHSSGLNAAMVRQVTSDPLLSEVLVASTKGMLGPGWDEEVGFRQKGSLLLLGREDKGLSDVARWMASKGFSCTLLSREEAIDLVPLLKETDFASALFTPSDGVMDIHALLWRYLRCARSSGVTLLPRTRLVAIKVEKGAISGIATNHGFISCRVLVNAAGAWANPIARLAGIEGLAMKPYKRHLMVTPPLPFVDPEWPFVWDTVHEYYFRPEGRGLLLSPGDQTEAEPGEETKDPQALETLAQKLAMHCPTLADLPVLRYWAGLRTITEDGRFAIGFDPRLKGLFWVSGLGGHGMTGSCVVGEIAARLILGMEVEEGWRQAFDPGRLIS